MLDDSNIHPPSPGKSILVICSDEASLERVRQRALNRPWPAPVNVENRYRLQCLGDSIEFMLVRQVETQGRSAKYDEIYTCGHVFIPERIMHKLRVCLINSRDWPGYFSKFP